MVKNLSAMQETHVWSLGLEDPLDKGKATNCSIRAWGISVSFMISWTLAHQAPLSMGFPRQEYWSELSTSSPGESSWVRDWTQVSCIGRQILYHSATRYHLLKNNVYFTTGSKRQKRKKRKRKTKAKTAYLLKDEALLLNNLSSKESLVTF